MPLLVPILPGARRLSQSAGDLLWLISEAHAARLSGQYVDSRVPRPGSSESHDPAKITRAMEVAHTILGRLVETAGTRPPTCDCPQRLDLASSSPLGRQGASFIDAQHPSSCLAPPKPTTVEAAPPYPTITYDRLTLSMGRPATRKLMLAN